MEHHIKTKEMEGDKFSSFARNYLRKRPRIAFPPSEPETASTSTSNLPSTSAEAQNHSTNRVRFVRIEPSDEQLLSWQEQQISKCIVDNTVNRVVESYLTFFEEENPNGEAIPDFDRDAHLTYQAYRANRTFEESAILWAIDEHGLQQHTNEAFLTSSSSSSSSSPIPIDSQYSECNECGTNANATTSSSNIETQPNRLEEPSTSTASSSDHAIPTTSRPSSNITSVIKHEDSIPNGSTNDNEHFEFMEAAVAVAIQEKGLIPYSIQMSPNR